jgi:hypothetical protein
LIPSADGALAWPSPILPRWLGKTESEAKREYRNYVKKGIDQGRRPELVGGGLIRSQGGWSAVKALRRAGNRELGDDRILGSGGFVKQVLKEAEGNVKYQLPVKEQDRKIDEFITQLCHIISQIFLSISACVSIYNLAKVWIAQADINNLGEMN